MFYKKLSLIFILSFLLIISAPLHSGDLGLLGPLNKPDSLVGKNITSDMSVPQDIGEKACIPGITNRSCEKIIPKRKRYCPRQRLNDDSCQNTNNPAEVERNCERTRQICIEGCRNATSRKSSNGKLSKQETMCRIVCNANYDACVKG